MAAPYRPDLTRQAVVCHAPCSAGHEPCWRSPPGVPTTSADLLGPSRRSFRRMSHGRLALAVLALALVLLEVGGCVSTPRPQEDYPPLIFNPRRRAISAAEAADSGLTAADLEAAVLPDGG